MNRPIPANAAKIRMSRGIPASGRHSNESKSSVSTVQQAATPTISHRLKTLPTSSMGNRYKKPNGKSFSTRQSAKAMTPIIKAALRKTAARLPRRRKANISFNLERGHPRLVASLDCSHDSRQKCNRKLLNSRKIDHASQKIGGLWLNDTGRPSVDIATFGIRSRPVSEALPRVGVRALY